jgi:hypothetical protein
MNERLKELAEQAGLDAKEIREDGSQTLYAFEDFDIERFAELVRQDEREANAKLCVEMGNKQTNQCFYDPWDCASSIRARINHEQD